MSKMCQKCTYTNPDEAMFCMKCGTSLKAEIEYRTTKLDLGIDEDFATRDIDTHIEPEYKPVPPPPPIPIIGAEVSLYLLDTRRVLPVMGKREFTIGRRMPGADTQPDVDLSPYKAFSLGVSRMHATVQVNDEGVFLTDLGSSNGTYLNNKRLKSVESYPLKHKDVVTLGLFRVQVLIRASG